LSAYLDSKGVLTIGVGHTGRMSPPRVTAAMTVTEAECDTMLATDLLPVEVVLNTTLTVPVSQNEFDALASLGFNIGAAALKGSLVLRTLNAGDVDGAALAFMHWCKPPVLTGRREAERRQFLEPDPPGAAGVSPSLAIAATRAVVLQSAAAARTAKARTTQTGGAVLATTGAAVSAGVSVAHHGQLAWIIAGLAATGAAIDGLFAWSHHKAAARLSANAATQAVLAPPATPSPAASPATA